MTAQLDPRIVITTIGGNCPVQAEGTIEGLPFYFRARHAEWGMGIGGEPVSAPDWYIAFAHDNAGWMSEDEARALIAQAAERYFDGEADGDGNVRPFRKKVLVETIDCTPSWEGMVSSLILLVSEGNAEGRKFAAEEITRMAKRADRYVASMTPKKD